MYAKKTFNTKQVLNHILCIDAILTVVSCLAIFLAYFMETTEYNDSRCYLLSSGEEFNFLKALILMFFSHQDSRPVQDHFEEDLDQILIPFFFFKKDVDQDPFQITR